MARRRPMDARRPHRCEVVVRTISTLEFPQRRAKRVSQDRLQYRVPATVHWRAKVDLVVAARLRFRGRLSDHHA